MINVWISILSQNIVKKKCKINIIFIWLQALILTINKVKKKFDV